MGKDPEKGKYASPEGSPTWEYLSVLFGTVGAFILGTLLGWNSPSLAEFKGPNSRIPMTADEASTLAASLSPGHLMAAVFSTFIVDRIGRRRTILVSTVPLLISWGMIMMAEHVMVLSVARIMGGFTMGMVAAVNSIYFSEILSANIRGALSAINGIAFSLGGLFEFAVGPFLGVRTMAGLCMAIAMIYFICFWFAPESPYFFMMMGREDEAEAALEKLRGKTDVADELELIRATLREKGKALIESHTKKEEVDPGRRSALKQLFTIRGNLKALFLGLVLTTMQHMCGLGVILGYCHLILNAIGSKIDVYWASMIFCGIQILSTILTVVIVDKAGRRSLLFSSAAINVLLLGFVATYFFLMEHTDIEVKDYSMIPLCCIFSLVIPMTGGIASVGGILMSEIFATDVKLLGHCIITVSGSVMGLLSTKYYLIMASSPSYGHSVPLFGFVISTFLCALLLIRWLPETKGKTLLEIQQKLNA